MAKRIEDTINFIQNSDNLMSFGKSFATLNGQPLDKDSIFNSKAAAENYAKTPAAFVGKQIVVVENGNATAYVIQPDESLKEIGATIVIDTEISETSENPVQNKVIYAELNKKQNLLKAGENISITKDGTISATGGLAEIPVASSSSLGGVMISNDFEISADGMLTLYRPIAVESFTNNKNTVAMGTEVSEITFSWKLNKVPTKLTIANTEILEPTAENTFVFTPQTPIKEDTRYTLKATDSKGAEITVPTIIDFKNYIYWGIAGETITESQAKLLANKELSDEKIKNISVTLGLSQYLYYILPERIELEHGEAIFSVDGFEGGFDEFIFDSAEPQQEKQVVQITNEAGFTENYLIYRSANDNLGTIKVEVR